MVFTSICSCEQLSPNTNSNKDRGQVALLCFALMGVRPSVSEGGMDGVGVYSSVHIHMFMWCVFCLFGWQHAAGREGGAHFAVSPSPFFPLSLVTLVLE